MPFEVLAIVALLATVTMIPGVAGASERSGVRLFARCVVHPVSGIISMSSIAERA